MSFERATYWATKAADAGDPRGWLVLGFEYSAGLLGGDPPFTYRMAMDAYKKAADGRNCLAMMQIGELYSKGNGVPADKASAQSWQAKAQSCQGGNLALLQQQLAQYRARVLAARNPMLAAIPVIPKSAPLVARNGHGSGVSANSKLAAIAAALVVGAAIVALIPHSPTNLGNPSAEDPNLLSMQHNFNNLFCSQAGGTPGTTTSGPCS